MWPPSSARRPPRDPRGLHPPWAPLREGARRMGSRELRYRRRPGKPLSRVPPWPTRCRRATGPSSYTPRTSTRPGAARKAAGSPRRPPWTRPRSSRSPRPRRPSGSSPRSRRARRSPRARGRGGAGASSARTTTSTPSCRRSGSGSRGPAAPRGGPHVLDEALPRGDDVDGVDHGPELAEGVLHALVVHGAALDRDLHALRVLVDLVEDAAHAVDPLEGAQAFRHLDERRLVRLEDVQDEPLDVSQGISLRGFERTGLSILNVVYRARAGNRSLTPW